LECAAQIWAIDWAGSSVEPALKDIGDYFGKQLFIGPTVGHELGNCFFRIERNEMNCSRDRAEATSSPIVSRLSNSRR
jgi:hypothetical protein